MAHDEEIMGQMSTVLSELIQVATGLKEAATTSLDKEEIERLQKEQAALVDKLLTLDQQVAKQNLTPKQHLKIESKIAEQIGEFQKLNSQFVDQLKGRISCIQFTDEKV